MKKLVAALTATTCAFAASAAAAETLTIAGRDGAFAAANIVFGIGMTVVNRTSVATNYRQFEIVIIYLGWNLCLLVGIDYIPANILMDYCMGFSIRHQVAAGKLSVSLCDACQKECQQAAH